MQSVTSFLRTMQRHGLRRIIATERPVVVENVNFNDHKVVAFGCDSTYSYVFGAFVHRVNRGPSQGGLRCWQYDTIGDIIDDGLRLSRGMSQKSALAGLWWGGGKGIIAYPECVDDPGSPERRKVFNEYGAFVSSLNGCYYTAEDVGTNTEDMDHVFETTRYVTCISESKGGSGNPSAHTARGVVSCLESLEELRGKVVAVQGLGNVSLPMVDMLVDRGVKQIIATDVDPEKCQVASERHSRVTIVEPDAIYAADADIFVPNALGGILNARTIPQLRVSMVCGAANNQLLTLPDAEHLQARDITYVPDFVVNRMGIVNCANESYGKLPTDWEMEKHYGRDDPHSLPNTIDAIVASARDYNVSTNTAAHQLADVYMQATHPIFGDRFVQIADAL